MPPDRSTRQRRHRRSLPGFVLLLAAALGGSVLAAPVDPMFTRFAVTAADPVFEWRIEEFSDVTIKQADGFDGRTSAAGVLWPLSDTTQLRILLPLYTSGEATITDIVPEKIDLIGTRTHIRGAGGVFDFFTVTHEKQTHSEADDGYNRSRFFGLGSRLDYLDTTHEDRFNHQGKLLTYGVRRDRAVGDRGTRWLREMGVTWYFISDDLNPSGGQDNFIMLEALGAVAFEGWHGRVYPVLEAGYRGVPSDYHDLFIAPQVSLRLGESTFLTAAVRIGVSDDAPGPNYLLRVTR